jgi:hypothetical protein
MPGIGEEIEGAMQQAPHPERQFIRNIPNRVFPADAGGFCILFEDQADVPKRTLSNLENKNKYRLQP